jgi:hypothetical protein
MVANAAPQWKCLKTVHGVASIFTNKADFPGIRARVARIAGKPPKPFLKGQTPMNTILRTSLLSTVAMFAKAEGAGGAPAEGKTVGEQIAEQQAGTALQHTAPTSAQGAVVLGGRAFKVKQVTRNVFPQRDNQTLFVRFIGATYQGKELANPGPGPKKEPPVLAEVSNLETGELGLIIVNKVLAGELAEKFPNDGYVGKEFAITMKPVEGKRYKTFVLYELEPAAAAE